ERALRQLRVEAAPAHARLVPVLAQQLLEGALADPDALGGGIEIDEEAQDAIAVGRAVRPGVDVDQLVAGVGREAAALLLDGPEAGGSGEPVPGELRHAAPEELLHRAGVYLQDAPRPVDRGPRGVHAGELASARVVADVLAAQPGGEARPQKLLIFRG